MQKILQGIKQIDKINYSSRHLIDYSNLKQGILKYQNNFLRLDQVDFFYIANILSILTLIIIYFLSLIKIRILEKKINTITRAESLKKIIKKIKE